MPRPTKKTAAKAQEATPAVETKTEQPAKIAPKTKARMAIGNGKFDIFSDTGKARQTKDMLAKVGMADGFKSAAEINRDYLPLPWMAFQYLIGRIGLPVNTIIEFIGQENTGKSSLVAAIIGSLIQYNIPCFYGNTEPKMLESDWLSRLVSSDLTTGEKVKEVLEVSERLYTLDEMDKLIRQWIKVKRVDQAIPKDVPLVVVVDTITKLLNPEEAAVLFDQKTSAVALDKGISDISKKPGVTAKWLHEWSRAIKSVLEKENVTLICVSGQNINMNAGATSFAADGGASLNKTRPGGTALNQSAAIQITITRKGMLKATSGETIGEVIRARVVKNSYGPKRSIEYGLRNDFFNDGDGYVHQAIDMEETFCGILAEKKIMGITCNRKLYSSEELGVYQAKAASLYARIVNDPELTYKIGTALKISGYEALSA